MRVRCEIHGPDKLMKCTNDKEAIEWIKSRPESSLYIEQWLERNGRVYLMSSNPTKLIFRVKKSLIKKLKTKELESHFLNQRLFEVL